MKSGSGSRDPESPSLPTRRDVLRGAVAATVTVAVAGCAVSPVGRTVDESAGIVRNEIEQLFLPYVDSPSDG